MVGGGGDRAAAAAGWCPSPGGEGQRPIHYHVSRHGNTSHAPTPHHHCWPPGILPLPGLAPATTTLMPLLTIVSDPFSPG